MRKKGARCLFSPGLVFVVRGLKVTRVKITRGTDWLLSFFARWQ